MNKSATTPPDGEAGSADDMRQEAHLRTLRHEIDQIDDQLIALLCERAEIVRKVGEYKANHFAGQCPLRPGREALMLRRIYDAFRGKSFPPAAAAAIWRLIISASTAIEGSCTISALAGNDKREPDYAWPAWQYFGGFTPVIRQNHAKRVLGDILDGKAQIGILPYPSNEMQDPWWVHLCDTAAGWPRIFAQIPFVRPAREERGAMRALAIGKIVPEATGSDVSFLVIEAGDSVSQQRLVSAFSKAGLKSSWISIAPAGPGRRYHFLEVEGFLGEKHPKIEKFRFETADIVSRSFLLGACATPIIEGA